jgi:ribosomal protein S18 acetylase RimI-like enzyme
MPVCAARGPGEVLLIVPRPSAPGKALALARGATFDHAEHALVLRTAVPSIPHDEAVSVRTAVPDDAAKVGELLEIGFGFNPATEPDDRTLVVERHGDAIGTLRLVPTDAGVGIYGFVIEAALRGRGIGRDVLSRVCADARAAGAAEVSLEVAVDNDHALGLYTSLGFEPHITEDYYRLQT